MNYEAMGKRIRARRRAMHMTQEQVAELSGISLSFVGHIERGSRKASLETLVAISNALKISPGLLLQDSLLFPESGNTPSNRQRNLINEISRVIIENYEE